jgi:hypothetical protein
VLDRRTTQVYGVGWFKGRRTKARRIAKTYMTFLNTCWKLLINERLPIFRGRKRVSRQEQKCFPAQSSHLLGVRGTLELHLSQRNIGHAQGKTIASVRLIHTIRRHDVQSNDLA